MPASRIIGGLAVDPPGRIEGWCWSPDQPDDRRVAEILVDDIVVAAIVAARFRADLVERGAGDGRHAFSIRLDDDPAARHATITARDQETGQIFASISFRDRMEITPPPPALAAIGVELERCFAQLRTLPQAPDPTPRLAAVFGRLGDRLAAHGRGTAPPSPVAVATATLRRRFAPIVVPYQAAPRVSLIVQARPDIAQTYAALAALAPVAGEAGAEIILADDGQESLTALLPMRVGNLALVHAPDLAGVVRSARAAGRARAPRCVFIDIADAPLAAVALRQILEDRGDAPILAGGMVLRRAARLGVAEAMPALLAAERSGLVLAINTALFRQLDGFDPAMEDDIVLACVDLCLRARHEGHAVAALAERARGGVPREVPARGTAAEIAFARTWQRAVKARGAA